MPLDRDLVERVRSAIHVDRLLETAFAIMEVHSPTCDAGRCADRVAEILESAGLAVERPVLLKEQLRRAIATLDQDDAALFLLRYVEGLSNEELAAVFHQEKNNIAVRLHRIRQKLQAELER